MICIPKLALEIQDLSLPATVLSPRLDDRASNFYCMAITAKPLPPSSPPLAADWAAISVAAALETRVDAATVVASAAIAVAVTNNNDHPCDGHDVNDCLHDGYKDVIVKDGPPFVDIGLVHHIAVSVVNCTAK